MPEKERKSSEELLGFSLISVAPGLPMLRKQARLTIENEWPPRTNSFRQSREERQRKRGKKQKNDIYRTESFEITKLPPTDL